MGKTNLKSLDIPDIFIKRKISDGTCIMRNRRLFDGQKNSRYFAYSGDGNDSVKVKTYCNSFKFISQYDINLGVQYSKITKSFDLLLIPYLNTGMGEDEEVQYGVSILIYLMAYVKENYDVLTKILSGEFKTYSLEDMYYTLYLYLGFNLNLYIDEILEYSPFDVYDHFHKISRDVSIGVKRQNPDYFTGELICVMGNKGWVRVSQFKADTMGDEIYICDIRKFKDIIVDTDECNLSQSCYL